MSAYAQHSQGSTDEDGGGRRSRNHAVDMADLVGRAASAAHSTTTICYMYSPLPRHARTALALPCWRALPRGRARKSPASPPSPRARTHSFTSSPPGPLLSCSRMFLGIPPIRHTRAPQRDTPEILSRGMPAPGAVRTAQAHDHRCDDDESERRQRQDRPLYGDPLRGSVSSPDWSTPSPLSYLRYLAHSTADAPADMAVAAEYTEEPPPSEATGAALSNILGRLNIPQPSANGAPQAMLSNVSGGAAIGVTSPTMAWGASPEHDGAQSVSERGEGARTIQRPLPRVAYHGYQPRRTRDLPPPAPCLATHSRSQPQTSVPPRSRPSPTRWRWPRKSAKVQRPIEWPIHQTRGRTLPHSMATYGRSPRDGRVCGRGGGRVREGADGKGGRVG